MSTEKGNNKRIVKKTNKGGKTVNIKVSTEDIDAISKINNTIEDNDNRKKTSKIRYLTNEDEDNNIFARTKNLERQLNSLKIEMNKKAAKEFKKIESLNQQLSELENQQDGLTKENIKLLTKLKGIEKEVANKFENKFKISKIISKEREKANENSLLNQIKARDQQTNTMKKNIKREEKAMKVIKKKLKLAGEEKNLNEELLSLNDKISTFEKEIEKLNEMIEVHQNCEKEKSSLTSRLNILSNEIDFENKVEKMVKVEKKEQTKINYNQIKEYMEKNNILPHINRRVNRSCNYIPKVNIKTELSKLNKGKLQNILRYKNNSFTADCNDSINNKDNNSR
jgi:chromosome segregation ATPase